jgi:hypothetical protein
MLKREVLRAWENRATETQTRIDEEIEPELEWRQYELEIAQRLLEKAQDGASRETWQTQVDVLQMMIGMAEGDLAGHLLMHGNHTLTYCCTAPWRRVICTTSRAMESARPELKTGLFKVMIKGKRSLEIHLAHNHKTGAIGKCPSLVVKLLE